jgi:cytochrome P450
MGHADAEIPDFPMRRTCPWAPPPEYAALRQEPPRQVRLHDGSLAWLVTRHGDVRLALADPRLSTDSLAPGFPRRFRLVTATVPRRQSFWRMDPPEHTRLRRMIMPQFTARAVRAKRPAVERLIGELLDDLAGRPRPADLVEAFTLPLPCLVIGEIFGIPDRDQRFFTGVTQAVLSQHARPEDVYAGFLQMTEYLDALISAKEKDPADDLLSRLCTDYVATGQLTHDDVIAMARLMLVAGHETTAKALALSVLALLRHPGQLAELRRDPGLLKPAVEELLRYWSIPEDNIVRAALEDLEIGGARIAKGDGVLLAIPSANHDERVFPDPDRLDIHRDASQHITFGVGLHYCPGASLARLELELALPALFTRFPGLRLAVDFDDLTFRFPTLVYGVDELPVTW